MHKALSMPYLKSISEAAQFLGLGRTTIKTLISSGKLQTYKPGRMLNTNGRRIKTMIKTADLMALAEGTLVHRPIA